MTLDEAILYAEEVVKRQLSKVDALEDIPKFGSDPEDKNMIDACYQCAEEHRQFAEWFKELKLLKESEGSDKVYKKVAKELLDDFIEDQITIIGELSFNAEQSYNWLIKKVAKYAERLDENVDEWVKRIKAAREGGL